MSVKFGKLESGTTLTYTGQGHLCTIAPTGAGKGATSIIPFLLEYPGSVLVIDPKGENAYRTFHRRKQLNKNVIVIDPFEVTEGLGLRDGDGAPLRYAQFNPLDFISLTGDGITQAFRLADTMIVRAKNETDPHWSNEARALLTALILYVRADPEFHAEQRTLRTVNELASYPFALVGDNAQKGMMVQSPAYDGYVARIAERMRQKADREASSVWSTLQANLATFLDDRRISHCLARGDLDFSILKGGSASIFLVLPVQYLEMFNRFLRLMVVAALDRLYEGMSEESKPEPPIQFILDEFAHLGALEAVKTAYGLSRGAGIRFWIFLQSLSQLDDTFGQYGRETFIANSGAIELFNMNDMHGLEYFSKRIGERYVLVRDVSKSLSKERDQDIAGGRSQESRSVKEDKRFWFLPNELAAFDPDKKIVLIRSATHQIVTKVRYFEHPSLRRLAGL